MMAQTKTSLTRRTTHRPPRWAVAVGAALSLVTLWLGYAAFGLVTMLVFSAGFGGGLLLWLLMPARGTWTDIKVPYWTALVLFVIHRIDEKQAGFFAFLSEVTGTPTPAVGSAPVILLLIVSVGAWLSIPVLVMRDNPLGYYLAWTYFASLGITEAAHLLVFPWVTSDRPQYVPAMWTVMVLAPVAWWGMWRLASGGRSPSPAGG